MSTMEWKEILQKRIKAKRQILFSKDDPEILSLHLLIGQQPRKAVILWALDLAEETVRELEANYPADRRAADAVALTRQWAAGEIKMPVAKRAILSCHGAAREISSPADIARYHAVGQACGTVHAVGHAIGYPIYDLTARIRENGLEHCDEIIPSRIEYYIGRLFYWAENRGTYPGPWAGFIRD